MKNWSKPNMLQEWNPGYAFETFSRADKSVTRPNNNMANDNIESAIAQAFPANKSIHNKLLPRVFVPPSHHKPRYKQLIDILKKINESYFDRKNNKDFYYHDETMDKKARLIRSEFAEMAVYFSSVISYYYDIMSGAMGFFDKFGKWVNISYRTLVKNSPFSLARIKKFFKFLTKRKYVTIKRQSVRDKNGNIRGKAARKILHARFFIELLGIAAWKKIERLREKLAKKAKPVNDEVNKANLNTLCGIIKDTLGMKTTKDPLPQIVKTIPEVKSTQAQNKALVEKAYRMHLDNPSKRPSDYLKLLMSSG